VDRSGKFALVAYNEPSGLSVHHIKPDGTIGHEVHQPNVLDVGVYAHQVLTTPSNKTVILVTRGYFPTAERLEIPGAIKVFKFEEGILTNKSSIAPHNGSGFGPRHLDFHPHQPWVYVTLERQSKLHVFALQPDGDLSPQPLFVKDTLLDPSERRSTAGPIHVHPNGRFVYLSNRGGWASTPPADAEFLDGLRLLTSTDSSIVVYAIDPLTGEPTMIQTIDSQGAHPRTFSLDASGRLLVTGALVPVALRTTDKVSVLPAGLTMFQVAANGTLEFVRKYDLDIGDQTQWWTGLAPTI
jgi:6-phosphogluconolactonase (cycloisomerase 2 family)